MFRSLLRTLPSLSGNIMLVCEINNLNSESDTIWSTYIRSASLQPLQNSLFNKRINVNLSEGSWEYDVRKFYQEYSDKFYTDNYNFIYNDYQKTSLVNYDADLSGRNRDYEFGCKRISFANTGYGFAFYAPIWISGVDDIPDEFELTITFENDEQKKIKIYINDESKYNYLRIYLRKYLNKIDDNVIYFIPNSSKTIYYGIDAEHGGFVRIEDSRLQQYISAQTDIIKFDQAIADGFKNNTIIIKQIIPLCFYFNIEDILDNIEKKYFVSHKVKIVGKYIKNSNPCEFYDFDIDYTTKTFYEYHYSIDNKNGKRWQRRQDEITGTDYNVLDNSDQYCLYENKNENYYYINKMTPRFCGWKLMLSDVNHPYITNASTEYINESIISYGQYPINVGIDPYKYIILNNAQLLTIGYLYKNYSDVFAKLYPSDTSARSKVISHYNKVKNTNLDYWYTLINQYDENYISDWLNSESADVWTPVKNKYAYYHGVLYDFNNIKDFDNVDCFGVFIRPVVLLNFSETDAFKYSNKISIYKTDNGLFDSNIESMINNDSDTNYYDKLLGYDSQQEFESEYMYNKLIINDNKSLININNANKNRQFDFDEILIKSKIDDFNSSYIKDPLFTDLEQIDDQHTYLLLDDFDKLIPSDIKSNNALSNIKKQFTVILFNKTNRYSSKNLPSDIRQTNNIFIDSRLNIYESNYYISLSTARMILDLINKYYAEVDANMVDKLNKYLLELDPELSFISNAENITKNTGWADQLLNWPYTSIDWLKNNADGYTVFIYGYVHKIETEYGDRYAMLTENIDDVYYTQKLWVDSNGIEKIEKNIDSESYVTYSKYINNKYKNIGYGISENTDDTPENIRQVVTHIDSEAQLRFEIDNDYPILFSYTDSNSITVVNQNINYKNKIYSTSYNISSTDDLQYLCYIIGTDDNDLVWKNYDNINDFMLNMSYITDISFGIPREQLIYSDDNIYLLSATPLIYLYLNEFKNILEYLPNFQNKSDAEILSYMILEPGINKQITDIYKTEDIYLNKSISQLTDKIESLFNGDSGIEICNTIDQLMGKVDPGKEILEKLKNSTYLYQISMAEDEYINISTDSGNTKNIFMMKMVWPEDKNAEQFAVDLVSFKKLIPMTDKIESHIDNCNFQYYIYRDMHTDEFRNDGNKIKLNNQKNFLTFDLNRVQIATLLEGANSRFTYNNDDIESFNLMRSDDSMMIQRKGMKFKVQTDSQNFNWLVYAQRNKQSYIYKITSYDSGEITGFDNLLHLLYNHIYKKIENLEGLNLLQQLVSIMLNSDAEYIETYISNIKNIISMFDQDSIEDININDTKSLYLLISNTNKYIDEINNFVDQCAKDIFSSNQSWKTLSVSNLFIIGLENEKYDTMVNRLKKYITYCKERYAESDDEYNNISQKILIRNILRQLYMLTDTIYNDVENLKTVDEDLIKSDLYDFIIQNFGYDTIENDKKTKTIFEDIVNYIIRTDGLSLYNSIYTDNIKFAKINDDDIDYVADENLHVATVVDANGNIKKKAYYLLDLATDNIYCYNLPSSTNNILFTKINDVDLTVADGAKQFVDKIFNELIFLYKDNPFNSFRQYCKTLIKPTAVSQKISYDKVDTLTEFYRYQLNNGLLSADAYNSYRLENISNKIKYSNISFNRYFNYIEPVFIKSQTFNHRWQKIYKDDNTVYDGFNIYFGKENIYKYPGIVFINNDQDMATTDETVDNNISIVYPYEYKYFNDNLLYVLEDRFEWAVGCMMTYDQLLEMENDKNTLEIFKKYLKIYHYKNLDDENEILFLYNQYNKSYKSENIKLDFGNTKKLYKLKYIFTLK